MESESSAKHILSLFSSSKLESFSSQPSSRTFYRPSPPTIAADDDTPDQHVQEPARKRRRRSNHAGGWTCREIKAVEMYRDLAGDRDEIDDYLRDLLLPHRTNEEVKLQLVRIEQTIKERRGSKLLELGKEEIELEKEEEKVRVQEMEKDIQRRKRGLDDVLGLDSYIEGKNKDGDFAFGSETQTREKEHAKQSLDRVLGLRTLKESGETDEQRRKRELDEALGLV